MQKIQNIPLVCGLTDAFLVLITALIIVAVEGKAPPELIDDHVWIFFGVVLPFCILVGWRGSAHTKRLMAGHRGCLRPAIEGFLAGFLPFPFIQAIGIVNEAAAAGPPWPSPGHATFCEWSAYLLSVSEIALLIGIVGAVCGLVFSGVNRLLVLWWIPRNGVARKP